MRGDRSLVPPPRTGPRGGCGLSGEGKRRGEIDISPFNKEAKLVLLCMIGFCWVFRPLEPEKENLGFL